jgi:predicted metal-dependent phosphoesterase TrpH
MPPRQSYFDLCRQMAQARSEQHRADLHLHTCHSDGAFTAEEIVRRATSRGLGAIAITDHDTFSGYSLACQAAKRLAPTLEIVPGVEITSEYRGCELHLLAYFFRSDDRDLNAALSDLRCDRIRRFGEMLERLKTVGISLDETAIEPYLADGSSPGRRTLAMLLAAAGKAANVDAAFARYLRDGGPIALPKRRLPVADALAIIRVAGGVSSWAHPPDDVTLEQVLELRELGLNALEVVYPSFSANRQKRLRELAAAAGLAVSGGSDCHGPTPVRRAVGAFAVTQTELERLRERATR